MRFLEIDDNDKITLTKDLSRDEIPARYAILSHTWSINDEDEVTFTDLQDESSQYRNKAGYQKIDFCGKQARRDGIQYFWIDTCCINKPNLTELSEAIASMFRWYQNAAHCYVFLSDVPACLAPYNGKDPRPWESAFRNSRWFKRGWTLQELLAPRSVVFFSQNRQYLGTKIELQTLLHDVTKIPVRALAGESLAIFPVEERKRWSQGRTTKKTEDQAYCLLGLFNVQMSLRYGEGEYAFVRLSRKIDKVPNITIPLRIVQGAEFDAYAQTHSRCHPATRVQLLQTVRDWAHDQQGTSIFWLKGMAGTGKSTISCTIAKELADLGCGGPVSLGATFFFKRGEGDRASATALFPTISSQLARRVPHFDVFLAQSVKLNPQICDKSLGEQFNKLICDPLKQLPTDAGLSSYVIVLDALDECAPEVDIRTVLQLWPTLPTKCGIRLRLFLTSRPELVIRLGFQRMPADQHQDLALHEIAQPIVEHDILAFLSDALASVREEYNAEAAEDALAVDWPGTSMLQDLTNIAVPLFIVAATIYRFIRDANQPQKALSTILLSRKLSRLFDIATMYNVVLEAFATSGRDTSARTRLFHDFQSIVGAIVCLAEPLSRAALSALLGVSISDIRVLLQNLHAVLDVPLDANAVIRPLHLSFSEYVTSTDAQLRPHGINAEAAHTDLWKRCLQLLSGPLGLREDICNLRHPGRLRVEIASTTVSQHLSSAVEYACRYWVYHFQSSTSTLSNDDEVHVFLKYHFLHWLEALSLLDRLADAIHFLDALLLQNKSEKSDELVALLQDARRFTLMNRHVVEQAPLQLYSSALAFAPRNSLVRCQCGSIANWIAQFPLTRLYWSPELQRLEGHMAGTTAVAFSPDGLLLVSGSNDCTVRLWEVSTGKEKQILEGHYERILKVFFSADGSQLVSMSDHSMRLWQVSTGHEIIMAKWDTAKLLDVVFLPNGQVLAAVLTDDTVQLWKLSTDQETLQLSIHDSSVLTGRTWMFSPKGHMLASIRQFDMVHLYDTKCGQLLRKFENPAYGVSLVFSPDGTNLTVVSAMTECISWRVDTGEEIRRFRGHEVVAFSADGRQLATLSTSDEYTIRVEEVSTTGEVHTLSGHNLRVKALAFSSSDGLLASASHDGTVHLWQLKADHSRRVKAQHEWDYSHTYPPVPWRQLVVSPDGRTLAIRKNRSAFIWSTGTDGEMHARQLAYDMYLGSPTFAPDSRVLAIPCRQGVVYLWDISTMEQVSKIEDFNGRDSCVAFAPNSRSLACGSEDMTVRLWDVYTGRELQRFEGHRKPIESVTFMPNGRMVASVSSEGPVRLWEVSTGRQLEQTIGAYHIDRMLFSPDGDVLATSSGLGLQLWNMATGASSQAPTVHRYRSSAAMAFSSRGELLAVAWNDCTIQLLDSKTSEEIQRFNDKVMYSSIRFSINDTVIATEKTHFPVPRKLVKIGQLSMPRRNANAAGPVHNIALRHGWLEYRGKRLLWLPIEYRDKMASLPDNTVAFMDRNGTVSLLKIKAEDWMAGDNVPEIEHESP